MPGATAVTIGNFDGVHLGHAELVRRARAHGRVVALVFDPHPLSVLRPDAAPARLMPFERRAEILRAMGADEVERLEPRPGLLNESPAQFIGWVFERFAPTLIVEGSDFRFGKGRAGDGRVLTELCAARGARAEIVEPVTVSLSDQSIVTASSTIVRWLVARGRADDAARVLGRPYELIGEVVRGDRRGREIGFPTANLRFDPPALLPADGVYAGAAALADGRRMPAAIHVGPRATFDRAERTVEAHIPGWAGPLAEGGVEYGWPLRLEFTAWLRDQARFDSVASLIAQIERDVARARLAFDSSRRLTAPSSAGAAPAARAHPLTPAGASA